MNKEKIKEYVFEEKNFKEIKSLKVFERVNDYRDINNKYFNILKQIEKFNLSKYETGSSVFWGGVYI